FSRTTIGRCGSIRRARDAALRPAATPPMTTNAIGALFLFPHSLHKIQDIEAFDLAIGVVAVDGVLLVGEDLEDGGELGHDEQLDVAAVEVDQLDVAAGLAEGGGAHDQGAEAGAVDEVDAGKLEGDVDFARGGKQAAAL